jgi:hypothetical protein
VIPRIASDDGSVLYPAPGSKPNSELNAVVKAFAEVIVAETLVGLDIDPQALVVVTADNGLIQLQPTVEVPSNGTHQVADALTTRIPNGVFGVSVLRLGSAPHSDDEPEVSEEDHQS